MSLSKLTPTRGATLATILGKGRFKANQAITTGQTIVQDVDVSDFDLVTILVSMTATAITDLVVSVAPVLSDGTIFAGLLPVSSPAVVLVAGKAVQAIQVNVTGLQGIEIGVKNANAGSETITFIDVFAGVTGTDF